MKFESNITFNSIFEIASLSLFDLTRGLSYNINFTLGQRLSGNSEIHNQIANSFSELIITPEWKNISLVAQAELVAKNKTFTRISNHIEVDYRRLFEGTRQIFSSSISQPEALNNETFH